MDERFVWVTDKDTGHAYPEIRELAQANPTRYVIHEDHPVRDSSGRLLEAKPHKDIKPTFSTIQPIDKEII